MIPINVSICDGCSITIDGKKINGQTKGHDIGLKLEFTGDRASIKEPVHGATASFKHESLISVSIIVGSSGSYVLANYDPNILGEQCCVTACGSTACGIAACLSCDGNTTCCS